jgi:hypothetical protein
MSKNNLNTEIENKVNELKNKIEDYKITPVFDMTLSTGHTNP